MMWPFKNKYEAFGFNKDREGNLTFALTEEEAKEVENVSKMFEEYAIHPDYYDAVQNAIIAHGLSNCANTQIMLANLGSNKDNRKNFIEKAFASMTKAYSHHQLPIYLYEGACLMVMLNKTEEARDYFSKFLKEQSEFEPNQIDELNLIHHDIETAIKDAEAIIESR